jgi:hypothetical protein
MRKIVMCFSGMLLATAACSGNDHPAPGGGAGASSAPVSTGSADSASEIRRFLDARYTARDVRHSFRTALGQDIDCIDFFAQPGVKALAARGQGVSSIPRLPDVPAGFRAAEPAASALEPGVAFDGSLDDTGSVRSCPEGTVPEVRITAEQIQRAGGLEAFRKAVHTKSAPPKAIKHGPDQYGDCEGDYEGYAHVVGTLLTPDNQPIVAGSSVMSIYGPTIPAPAVNYGHSIAQTWMVGYSADYSDVQTVETGWNVDNWVYDGDTHVPHLFIFSTTDDYVSTGCYNDWDSAITGYAVNDAGEYEVDDAGNLVPGTCVPWVQLSRQYTPGMALPASAIGAVDPHKPSTLPKELSLSTIQIAGDWWIFIQVSGGPATALGFYPGKSFDVSKSMTYYEVGGEVATNPPIGADGGYENVDPFPGSGIEMGSGQPPAKGQGYAAYHRNYAALVTGPTEGGAPLIDSAFVCATDQPDYTYSATPKPVSQAAGPWINYFYYGGDPPAAPGSAQ